MRLIVIRSLAFALVFVATTALAEGPSQGEGPFHSYFSPWYETKLTITSANGVVSYLEVPVGVYLNIDSDVQEDLGVQGPSGYRVEYGGHITIRTRRADEVGKDESKAASEIMSKAPVVIELKDAQVLQES